MNLVSYFRLFAGSRIAGACTRASLIAWLATSPVGILADEVGAAASQQAVEPTDAVTREQSALDRRLEEEREAAQSRFAITAHKPNYLLFSYNTHANESFEPLDPGEIKFQLSLKVSLVDDVLGGDISFGYTQVSFWQAFNSDISSPFRESNYEPEVMWRWVRPRRDETIYNRGVILGVVHQSNGGSLLLSRSWNRVYVNLIFEYQDFYLSVKPWYRIPEGEKTSPTDAGGDDNPDIADYLGYGEITAVWARGRQRAGLMLRNNLDRHGNRGALQLDWSYRLGGKTQLYVQYFNGYGESLIDYNHSVNRIGVGLMLNNWL